jgi:hypothetical protein
MKPDDKGPGTSPGWKVLQRVGITREAVEAASESDRHYFLDHSRAKYRDRPFVPGEGPTPEPDEDVFVRVHQLAPGIRVRALMVRKRR